MLAVPLLVGVAVSRPSAWQLLLAVAALGAYLASAPALEWLRSRRREQAIPAAAFGVVLTTSAVPLGIAYPALLLLAAWAGLMSAIAGGLALADRPRSLIASLAQAAQAIALVPATALVSGAFDDPTRAFASPPLLRASLLVGIYLIGSVFLVRSMIRERGHDRFLALSVGFHLAGLVASALLLAWPYAAMTAALAGRAIALPLVERRLAAGAHRLRPIHIGLVEIAASVAVVVAAFTLRF
jgi:hypothetical protein